MVLVLSCSRTKDSFTSRVYHQMVSQFNPLFNGEQALLKGEQTLARNNQDDFSEILKVFPIGTEEDAASVKPDMDKAIEKATKVIQKHSMMIRNDQKNNFIDDSYLLIGKARYYNYEHLAALETFNYVIQQFPESKVHTEAILWAGKTETALGNYLAAKDRFESIYRDENLDRKLKPLAFASYAQLEIYKGNNTAAYQLLEQAVNRSTAKWQKVRWTFIMGQLQVRLGNGYRASQLFEQVVKKGPPYELLFQAQLARARNYDVDLQDPSRVFRDLEKMLKDEKNYDNRDQIYYVMAEIAQRMGDEAMMEDYLKQSIRVSTTNTAQKGLSYLKLAETNFNNSMYPLAAAYYDSAYTNLPADHEKYEEVETKKESLAGLVENLRVIATQDSLLALANMGEKQRLKKLREIVDKEGEAKERARQEEQNLLNNQPTGDNSIALAGQGSIQGGQWYFYNQNLRSSGLRDFRNRFGNRKLEDDWRRKDKKSNSDFAENDASDTTDLADAGEQDVPKTSDEKVAQYLENIPSTEEEIAAARRKIMVASLNIGDIYRNDLEDLPAAEKQYKELLEEYPTIEEKPRIWYTLYRINVVLEDQPEADKYKQLILSQYPESEYAALLKGGGLKDAEENPVSRQYYAKTYRTFKEGDTRKAMSMADSGLTAFAQTSEAPQFLLLKAYCLGQRRKTTEMETALRAVVAQYPGTEQAQQAQSILDHISQQDDPVASAGDKQQPRVNYQQNAQEEHKYLTLVPNTKGLVNNVTIDIINFNNKYFKNINLNAKSVYISKKEQMVLVSGLPNQQKAMQYFKLLEQQKVLEKNLKPNEIKHFVISNSNFTELYQEKDFSGYLDYFQSSYIQ